MLPHCLKKGKTWYIWHSTHSFEQNHHVNRMHVVPILWGHISEAQNVLCILFKHCFSLSWYRLIVFSVVTFSWISSTTKMKLHKKKRRVAAAMEEVQQERKTRCLCKVKNKNWHGDIYLSLLSQKNLPDSSYLLNNLACILHHPGNQTNSSKTANLHWKRRLQSMMQWKSKVRPLSTHRNMLNGWT